MIHMKCQYLFSRKKKKKNVCHPFQILLGILGVKLNYGYQEADDLHFACWVDNKLKYFSYFN